MNELMSHMKNVNVRGKVKGYTPLIFAIQHRYTKLFEYLTKNRLSDLDVNVYLLNVSLLSI
jgi:hypothetical protein